MTADLQQDIAKVAVAALADAFDREPDLGAVRFLTIELELKRGKPVEARAWIERPANVGKLLGDRRG